MQPIIKYILLLCLLHYSLQDFNMYEDYYNPLKFYVCPEDHFLINTKKRINCPTGSSKVDSSNGEYCNCGTDKYFDIQNQKCEDCPNKEYVVKNLNGTANTDDKPSAGAYLDHGCKVDLIYAGSNDYKKTKMLVNGVIGEPKAPRCMQDKFYNTETKSCEPCNSYQGNNRTYYFFAIGLYDTACNCKNAYYLDTEGKPKKDTSGNEFFWNVDTKKCENCGTPGLGKESSSKTTINTQCSCYSEISTWDSNLKQCIYNRYSDECSKKRQVVNPKTNLCEDCPEGSFFKDGSCYCEDKKKVFNQTKFKCVKNSEFYGYHNYRKGEITGSRYCLEGYPKNYVTLKCTKCPKGTIRAGGKCLCGAGELWDDYAFNCTTCPPNSRLGCFDAINYGAGDYSDGCVCDLNYTKINGSCYLCPNKTEYSWDHRCELASDVDGNQYRYNEFYNEVLPLTPTGDTGNGIVEEYVCLKCPENSYYKETVDGSYITRTCKCLEYGAYYDKNSNTCKITVISDDKSSRSSILRLSLFFFSLLLLFIL